MNVFPWIVMAPITIAFLAGLSPWPRRNHNDH